MRNIVDSIGNVSVGEELMTLWLEYEEGSHRDAVNFMCSLFILFNSSYVGNTKEGLVAKQLDKVSLY